MNIDPIFWYVEDGENNKARVTTYLPGKGFIKYALEDLCHRTRAASMRLTEKELERFFWAMDEETEIKIHNGYIIITYFVDYSHDKRIMERETV